MSWNMLSFNVGIGVGGIVGGFVMIYLLVEYVIYISVLIGLISFIIVFILKNRYYVKNLWLEKVCMIVYRSIFMILDLCMLLVFFLVFIYRYVMFDVEVYNIFMVFYFFG